MSVCCEVKGSGGSTIASAASGCDAAAGHCGTTGAGGRASASSQGRAVSCCASCRSADELECACSCSACCEGAALAPLSPTTASAPVNAAADTAADNSNTVASSGALGGAAAAAAAAAAAVGTAGGGARPIISSSLSSKSSAARCATSSWSRTGSGKKGERSNCIAGAAGPGDGPPPLAADGAVDAACRGSAWNGGGTDADAAGPWDGLFATDWAWLGGAVASGAALDALDEAAAVEEARTGASGSRTPHDGTTAPFAGCV